MMQMIRDTMEMPEMALFASAVTLNEDDTPDFAKSDTQLSRALDAALPTANYDRATITRVRRCVFECLNALWIYQEGFDGHIPPNFWNKFMWEENRRIQKIIVIAAFITAWELRQRVTISADDMPQCVVGLTKTLAMYRAQIFPMLQTALDKDIAEMPADVMVFFVGEADLATRHPI